MKRINILGILAAFVVTLLNAETNTTMLAAQMSRDSLVAARDILDKRKVEDYAVEYYLHNTEAYAMSLDTFYDDFSIVVTESEYQLLIFCLLPGEFDNYDRSRGMVERGEVCKGVYQKYRIKDEKAISEILKQLARNTIKKYDYFLSLDKYNKLLMEDVWINKEYVMNNVRASKLKRAGYVEPICELEEWLCKFK